MARRANQRTVDSAPRKSKRQTDWNALYHADETAWLEEMSRLVQLGQLDELDCVNLAEYLDSMARRDRREVESRLRVLIAHLLKWQYQPDKRSKSWQRTVLNQRDELATLLTGVLRQHAEDNLAKVYQSAIKIAAFQTNLPAATFPVDCPYSLEQILTEELS